MLGRSSRLFSRVSSKTTSSRALRTTNVSENLDKMKTCFWKGLSGNDGFSSKLASVVTNRQAFFDQLEKVKNTEELSALINSDLGQKTLEGSNQFYPLLGKNPDQQAESILRIAKELVTPLPEKPVQQSTEQQPTSIGSPG